MQIPLPYVPFLFSNPSPTPPHHPPQKKTKKTKKTKQKTKTKTKTKTKNKKKHTVCKHYLCRKQEPTPLLHWILLSLQLVAEIVLPRYYLFLSHLAQPSVLQCHNVNLFLEHLQPWHTSLLSCFLLPTGYFFKLPYVMCPTKLTCLFLPGHQEISGLWIRLKET